MNDVAKDPPAVPVSTARRQLDMLARQLLAMRSGLESLVLQCEDRPAAKALAHGLVDQLDAAFVVVGVLQATDDVGTAASSIEQPTAPAEAQKPPVFGAKRKAAAAAVNPPTTSPEGTGP